MGWISMWIISICCINQGYFMKQIFDMSIHISDTVATADAFINVKLNWNPSEHQWLKHITIALIGVHTVYPKKYAHGFVMLCFVVVMQSFIMNSHDVFIHIHQGCFAGTGTIVRLPLCQWSKPVGYGKISQCITTTKHSKAKTVCIFLGIYCISSFAHRL